MLRTSYAPRGLRTVTQLCTGLSLALLNLQARTWVLHSGGLDLLSSQYEWRHKAHFACVLNHFTYVLFFATPWNAARQAPLSMGFSRQEYWSGLSFPEFSRGSPQPRDGALISLSPTLSAEFFITSTTWEAQGTFGAPSNGVLASFSPHSHIFKNLHPPPPTTSFNIRSESCISRPVLGGPPANHKQEAILVHLRVTHVVSTPCEEDPSAPCWRPWDATSWCPCYIFSPSPPARTTNL